MRLFNSPISVFLTPDIVYDRTEYTDYVSLTEMIYSSFFIFIVYSNCLRLIIIYTNYQ